MSRASRQSLALLAVVHGCFKTIDSFNLADELSPTIHYGIEVSENVIKGFPETGDREKNLKWMTEKIHAIDGELNSSDSLYTMSVLIALAELILTDLIEKIKDKKKLNMLELIDEVVRAISDKVDRNKDNFEVYEEADRLLSKLYQYLGFSV